ncbi:hypothetical protein AN958_05131, partial [Leucoagaricus sp. SymC.cos]
FQVAAIKAQLQYHDTIIHTGTGMGKTAIATGVFANAKTKGMVTFMVSPPTALQTKQFMTFQDEYKLKAVAINSTGPNQLTANIMKWGYFVHFYLEECNILDIDVIVQWKLPSTVSSFIQHVGQAARGEGHSGVAVLLAKCSVFKSNWENIGQIGMIDKGKKTKKSI